MNETKPTGGTLEQCGSEWAVRYSYMDDPDPKDPGCVDPTRGVWSYLDGMWDEREDLVRQHFDDFAQSHPDTLVELIYRPVGPATIVESKGTLS